VANPAPIIQTFFMEESIADKYKIDGVVTLVDAKHAERHIKDGIKERDADTVSEAVEQIAYADRILLNKTDLVTEADVARVERQVRAINRMAAILKTQRSVVNLDYVLGVGGFDIERVEEEVNPRLLQKKEKKKEAHSHDHDHEHECGTCGSHDHSTAEHGTAHAHAHDHEHDHKKEGEACGTCGSHDHATGEHGTAHAHSHSHDHDHEHSHGPAHGEAGHVCSSSCDHDHDHDHDHPLHDTLVNSVSIVVEGEMDLNKVNRWLGLLLEVRGEDIYRMKGVLAIEGFDKKFVFQGVHTIFEGSPASEWKKDEPRRSRIVFIGRELDKEVLVEGFNTCVAKKKEPVPSA
jgi:G3E family GTPase